MVPYIFPLIPFKSIYRCGLEETMFPRQLLSYQTVVFWEILRSIIRNFKEPEKKACYI